MHVGRAAFTRFAGRFITVADRRPGWKIPIVFGWSGMRGVVSLAAALSIPALIAQGQPFPYRNLILIITFVVILVTLVFQGLTLPWLIRKLKIQDPDAEAHQQQQEITIRKAIAEASLNFLEQSPGNEHETNEHLRILSAKLKNDLKTFEQDFEVFNSSGRALLEKYQEIYAALLNEQRKALAGLNRKDGLDEDLIRKYLSLIDLEETKLKEVSV